MVAAYKAELYSAKWVAASKSFCGGGLEEGQPSFHGYKSASKFLHKRGRKDLAYLLRRVVCGGASLGTRYSSNQSCPLCEVSLDSPDHRWYQCKEIDKWLAEDDFALD